MFTILVDEDSEGSNEYNWKLGEEKPYPDAQPWYLVASGNELSQIRKLFANIPITTGTTCKWYDEMAKFIYNNLP